MLFATAARRVHFLILGPKCVHKPMGQKFESCSGWRIGLEPVTFTYTDQC